MTEKKEKKEIEKKEMENKKEFEKKKELEKKQMEKEKEIFMLYARVFNSSICDQKVMSHYVTRNF